MGRYEFYEIGDFHVVAHAVKKADKTWGAFAFIDRKADAGKRLAPAVRLDIEGDFNAEWAAINMAKLHARQCITRGEIDLQEITPQTPIQDQQHCAD